MTVGCGRMKVSNKDRRSFMITEFGKLLRIIRINSGDSAKDMADKMNISPAYLSAIENGKRNIPPEMVDIIKGSYKLSAVDIERLYKAIVNSTDNVKIDLSALADNKKRVFYALSQDDLDDDTVEQMCEIIKTKSIRTGGNIMKKLIY
jgi:transcriptional regulator with XRE-family HTH domain